MKTNKKKLAVLVSGGGSNMQSIMDGIAKKKINGEIVCVISSNENAYALKRAENSGIAHYVCALKNFESRELRDAEILRLLKLHNAEYVLLAGYLGIVTPKIINAFPYKVINIHPALLPKFGGKNFYGLNVHKAVLEAKERKTGATVHFVDSGTDTGLIIAAKSIRVLPSDTAENLQQRVLKNVEHTLFPAVVKDLCNDRIIVNNGRVQYQAEKSKSIVFKKAPYKRGASSMYPSNHKR